MFLHQFRGFGLPLSLISSKFPQQVRDADFDEKDKKDCQKNAKEDLASSINISMIKQI